MKKLKIASLYNRIHLIFIGLVLFILSLKYNLLFILFIIYSLFVLKRFKIRFYYVFTIVLVVISSLQYKVNIPQKIEGIVVAKNDNKSDILTIYGHILVLDETLNEGDIGTFSLINYEYETETFSYNNYLEYKGFKGLYKLESSNIKTNVFVLNKIRTRALEVVDNYYLQSTYIKMLILGDKTDDTIYTSSQKIGISFLLAISGLHIAFFIKMLEYIIDKITYKKKIKNVIILIFLLIFNILTGFRISVLRVSIAYILKIVLYKFDFQSLDNLCLSGLILLLIHPKYLYLIEFQFTYLISIVISLANVINENKTKLQNAFIISFVSSLMSFPIVINLNNEFNLLSLITTPLYALFFEFVLFPLVIINLFLPFLSEYFNILYSLFSKSIDYLSTIDLLMIRVGNINIYLVLAYFVLAFLLLQAIETKSKIPKRFFTYFIFLLLLINKPKLNPFYELTVFNCGQGDMIMIRKNNDGYTIVVDGYKDGVKLLKQKGVKKIDAYFITHGDSDHASISEDIIEEFEVKNIYTSKYANGICSSLREKYKVTDLEKGDFVKVKNDTYEILGPDASYSIENNNSLIIYTKILGKSILLTGDMEALEEENCITSNLDIDFYKAPHHGSQTSSTLETLNYLNPKLVLISVGKNNSYNHPDNTNLLNNYKCLRTDLEGSISIYFTNNRYYILESKKMWYNFLGRK